MKKCALLTCKEMAGFITDEPMLEEALQSHGWQTQWVIWNEPCDWNQFDIVLIRTTWDYFKDVDQFLKVIDEIEASSCQLWNSAEVVRWNANKTYMNDLKTKGIDIVPTLWAESIDENGIKSFFDKLQCEKIVCKPVVGAGAVDTFVLDKYSDKKWNETMSISNHKNMMIQPFMDNIQNEGEFSLHFFNKKHSHTILKKPKPGDFRSQEEFGSHIQKVLPKLELLQTAQFVVNNIQEELLYARVDMVCGTDGKFYLMELELIEPALYFRYDEASPDLFVRELEELIAQQT